MKPTITYESGQFQAEQLIGYRRFRMTGSMTLKDGKRLAVTVPKGFKFNISAHGAIAQLFVRYDDPKLLPAAAVHDFLVVRHKWPRLLALGPFLYVYWSMRPGRLRFWATAIAMLVHGAKTDARLEGVDKPQ